LSKLQKDGVITEWEEGVGRYHLLERLGAALEIVEPDADERRRQLQESNDHLDVQDSTIDSFERYLENRYLALPADFQSERGLPIGSGVTESAAETVVGRRAKNSGQRGSEHGLRGAVTLRAIHQSDRLPLFWTYFSRRYIPVVAEAA
jgi:hypothetical protein